MFAAELKPNETVIVPGSPDVFIRLSNAVLLKRPKRKDCRIVIQIADPQASDAKVAFAVLNHHNDNVPLDLLITSEMALRLEGSNIGGAVVHVTGAEEDPTLGEMDPDDLQFREFVDMLGGNEEDSDEDSDEDGDISMMQGSDINDNNDDDDDDSSEEESPMAPPRKAGTKQKPKASEQNVVVKRSKGALPLITHRSGLKYQDMLLGSGRPVKRGHNVALQYVLRLESGKVIDKADRRRPFTFRLGTGECIKGFDIGVMGMREGGERHVIVPPELGYGDQRLQGIPPGSTLFFDVTVVKAF